MRQCEISTKTIAALPCISEKLTNLGLCSIKGEFNVNYLSQPLFLTFIHSQEVQE